MGEKDLDSIGSIDMEIDMEYELENDHIIKNLGKTHTGTFDMDATLDKDGASGIFSVDLSSKPDSILIFHLQTIQKRKHHKKRINKKWLKRYGTKQIYTTQL